MVAPRSRSAGIAVLLLAVLPLLGRAEEESPSRPSFQGVTEVTASRIGDAAAVGRAEVILTREEIAALPVATVHDVLALLPGVGLARRGAPGVQADLGLRGATFEQGAVLLNGVLVSNPQTGHHSLDLFLPAAAIERVEVLYGPGSAVHGPGALGGAVNIVTGPPPATAFARAGSHHLAAGGLAGSLSGGPWGAVDRQVHTGFRDDTEAWVNQLAGGWSWRDGARSFEVSASAGERAFGAYGFYSTRFPLQRERTRGGLLVASATAPLGAASLDLAARLDRHRDEFVLDRTRPDWYRNLHHTSGALVDLALRGRTGGFDWVAGVEWARDEIDSSNLGRHHRRRGGLFAEAGRFEGPVTFSLQLRGDSQEPWGTVGTVAVGGAFTVSRATRLRLHYGQGFRPATFTELHYDSPTRVGNPELEPERGRSAEVGVDAGPWSLQLFERRTHALIDYLLGDDGVWRATNLGRVTTRGVEGGLALPVRGRLRWQRLGAVWLDSEAEVEESRSAYALAHPRLEATWSGSVAATDTLSAGWVARYRDPVDRGSWLTLDLAVDLDILPTMTVRLEADNVLDREASELHGIPLPGRWLSLTVTLRGDS